MASEHQRLELINNVLRQFRVEKFNGADAMSTLQVLTELTLAACYDLPSERRESVEFMRTNLHLALDREEAALRTAQG